MSPDERQPLARDHVELTPARPGGRDDLVDLYDVGAVTDRGLRHHRNEDAVELAIRTDPTPFIAVVVADGVSSSVDPDQASELASRVAVEHLLQELTAAPVPADGGRSTTDGQSQDGASAGQQALALRVAAAIGAARDSVAALAAPEARAENSPACTLVAAVVAAGHVVVGWLGDSRAYWVPTAGAAVPLTWDDSWAAEAIAAGAAPETAYRLPQAHAITAWLGHEAPALDPHLVAMAPGLSAAGGVLVVCSDGLWNYLTEDAAFADTVRELAAVGLAEGDASAAGLARRLTAWAVEAGGTDNITVAVVPARAIAATA